MEDSDKSTIQPPDAGAGTEDVKTMIKQGYDTIAQRYLDWSLPMTTPRQSCIDKTFALLGPDLLSQSTILELGCGAGVPIATTLASHCHHLVANDISSTQIALATRHLRAAGLLDKVRLVESDMSSLTFPEQTFDAVVAFYSLIHLSLSDQRDALEHVHSWLKESGLLTCNFGADADPGLVMDDWLGMRSFWSSYGAEGTLDVLRQIGFEVMESEVVFDNNEKVGFLWVVARK